LKAGHASKFLLHNERVFSQKLRPPLHGLNFGRFDNGDFQVEIDADPGLNALKNESAPRVRKQIKLQILARKMSAVRSGTLGGIGMVAMGPSDGQSLSTSLMCGRSVMGFAIGDTKP
jgi:hypothetical protein